MQIMRRLFGRKNAPAAVAEPVVDPAVDPAPVIAPASVEPKAAEIPPASVLPAAGTKVLGTKEQPVKKVLEVRDLVSVKAEGGRVIIKGYANTKGSADRYGDVPTVFASLRSYVYELAQFRKNPVMLLNHYNQVENIAGSFKALKEDENGLYFEAEFSESDYPPVKHARTVYAEGHAKALSIAGRWYFEDKDNPDHLTYAEIFEISLVAVGADPNALAAVEQHVPGKAPAPAPCCYRHAGGEQKDLSCATLEEVREENDFVEAVEKFTAIDEESAAVAEINRYLQKQEA